MIGSSSARGASDQGFWGVFDISLRDEVDIGLITCGGAVLAVLVTQFLSGCARGFGP